MEVPDSIEREVILPVPPARVWAALTQADQLGAWFGTQASIDLRPGGEVVFTWDGSTGPHGSSRGVIETVEPTQRFAVQVRLALEQNFVAHILGRRHTRRYVRAP